MVEGIKKEPLGNGFFVNVSPHHTFGTDAVLLKYFAKAKKQDKLVDLGTGCGIIPLLMLRDERLATAIGVDISTEAAELAALTVKELGIENFKVINADLKDLKGKVEFGCHTLVTCNPPYKAPNAGLKNPDKIDMIARHEVACTLRDIISVGARLLQTGGRLCLCHRPERLAELICLMHEHKVEPKRLRLVAQRKGEEPWLVLIEGRRGGNTGLRIEPMLYIEENGGLSDEMIEIYGAYKEAYL
ncbi:MAG: tRNA1(Val) (adenine(37)-N6)-methyltransferase [Acutalibacteraceae bacterium]|jgi:tRNA1Val (adenine37-N6)-methyltransferase